MVELQAEDIDQYNRVISGRPPNPDKASLNRVIDYINQYPEQRAIIEGASPTGLSPQNLEAYKQQALATQGSNPSEQIRAQELIAQRVNVLPPNPIPSRPEVMIGEVQPLNRNAFEKVEAFGSRTFGSVFGGQTPKEVFIQATGSSKDPYKKYSPISYASDVLQIPKRASEVVGGGVQLGVTKLIEEFHICWLVVHAITFLEFKKAFLVGPAETGVMW